MQAPYREIQPGARLRRYVECYWSQSQAEPGHHVVLPDGCVDILFSRSGAEPVALTVVGLMTSPLSVPSAKAQSFFGVRFRPGMASSFIPEAGLLTDRIIPLDDLMGSAARGISERLADSASSEKMAEIMDQLLRPLDPPDMGERVLRQIQSAEASFDQASAASGLSARHFPAPLPGARRCFAQVFEPHFAIPPGRAKNIGVEWLGATELGGLRRGAGILRSGALHSGVSGVRRTHSWPFSTIPQARSRLRSKP